MTPKPSCAGVSMVIEIDESKRKEKFDRLPAKSVHKFKSIDKRASQEILETPKRPFTPILKDRKSSIPTEDVGNSYKKSCRRKLDLDIENCQPDLETKLQDSVSKSNCIRVYTRILRPNECLKNSRKLGPNFPSIFKKARKSQLRRTAFDKLIAFIGLVCVTPTIQKKKNAASNKPNLTACKRMLRSRVERPPPVERPPFRRKRSKRKSNSKRDFFYHVHDWQVSQNFLRMCSSIRTQLGGCVEVPEFMYDNDGIHESIQNPMTGFEMLGAYVSNDSNVRVPSFMSQLDDEEEEDVSVNLNLCYDFYREALFDFSTEMIDGLHIVDDVSNDFSSPMVVDGPDKKDVSNNFDGLQSLSNQLILWNQNQNSAIVVHHDKIVSYDEHQSPPKAKTKAKKPPKAKTKAKKSRECEIEVHDGRVAICNSAMSVSSKNLQLPPKPGKAKTKKMALEVDEGQLNKFILAMQLNQGEGHFAEGWEGSVVDYVVGLCLIQACRDQPNSNEVEAFVAFTNLKSRFGVVSDDVTDSAIQGTELLSIAEGPFDEVVPEQLMVEKERPTSCPSSHNEVDSEDGNVNSSQSESTLVERKGKNDDGGELCVKNITRKNRTGCNRDYVDWQAVFLTPASELAVMLMKRGPKHLLACTIKDVLNWVVNEHGSIDLEYLKGVPLEEANERLSRIPGFDLKITESTNTNLVCGAIVTSPSSLPAKVVGHITNTPLRLSAT